MTDNKNVKDFNILVYTAENLPYIRKLAEENPLSKEIFDFCERVFTDSGEAEEFLMNNIRPFAKEQKCLTEFRSKQKALIKSIEKSAEQTRKKLEAEKRIAELEARTAVLPNWVWLDDRGNRRLDEIAFIEEFIGVYQLKYFSGSFFGIDGKTLTISISQTVQNLIGQYFTEKIAYITKRVVEGLQNKCYCDFILPDVYKIHIDNGYITTDEKGLFTAFIPKKEFCLNRLNVSYKPERKEPKKFLKLMHDLFKPEDIRTVQQFLGYLLLPTNRLQLAMIINGEGGEGKSQLGQIVADIIGEGNVLKDRVQRVEERFGLANCANRLLYLDDDLNGRALLETGNFKDLVTSMGLHEAERKGVQENPVQFYVRFLCFSNRVLEALHDHSEGFYRRLVILQTKPKKKSRKDIRNLAQIILAEEKEDIFAWMIDGLNDLIANGWELYISEESNMISELLKRENDSIEAFFTQNPYITLGEGGEIHTADLYTEYCYYCGDNAMKSVSVCAFSRVLNQRQTRYNIQKIDCLYINGKKARGFKGIKLSNTHFNTVQNY